MDMQEELLHDLHKQYAENDNAHTKNLITFIGSLLALYGSYGYVYTNYGKIISKYDTNDFTLVTIAVVFVLTILSALTIYFGYAHRRDHIIIDNIRRLYLDSIGKNPGETLGKNIYKEAFNGEYNPTKKKLCDFIPDFYNILYIAFIISEIATIIISALKICSVAKDSSTCPCGNMCIVLTIGISLLIISIYIKCHYYEKYRDFDNKRD